ncbi:DUF1080 domain-containing protein [Rhodohalobacter sp. SW132]|uniref:3-keto-disaccharide hydrolase n=2 Tax=Rhodohalobacter sp. SW132 TaxID=2293433 RepID=UPI000E244C49|nr:DUF1080 domain-containing protein [Rhodohalobacter sp. SW132]REL38288.1 DUF1080 domain-containing protein [Rhodohalobacter sp. SW132]
MNSYVPFYPSVLILLAAVIVYACSDSRGFSHSTNPDMNQLSEQEIEEGWKLLFDGENADLWRGYNMDRFPQQGWQIENGLLQFQPSTVENQSQGLDIITRETYTDFEFKLEWMVEEGGNSGIFYHVLEQEREIYWSGPEMQILDNENHPDAAQGVDGNRKAGSLYDLIPANPQNTNPFGEWNSIKIVSDGPVVEHWQNGEKVLEYERWTEDWFNMLHESKFQCYPEFGAIRNGHIGLQDHGDIVKFRNIKIREL